MDIIRGLEEMWESKRRRMESEDKPLILYNSSFVPEELLRAMGANSYLMLYGGDFQAAEAATKYILECINPLSRANTVYTIDRSYPRSVNFDYAVSAFADNHGGRSAELLEHQGIELFKIGVPFDWQSELSRAYYLRALRRMVEKIEERFGLSLDPEAAAANFRRSNELNGIFRAINELRKSDSVPISFEDYMRLQHLSLLLDDDSALELFKEALERCKSADSAADLAMPRLLIMGRAIAIGDYALLSMIDKSGCAVVAEILDEAVRVLDSDVSTEGDPLENFARSRYIERLPINTFQPSWRIRFSRLKELIREYRVDGVIWYQIEYDEIYDLESICVEKWLKELGIPMMKLETGYDYSPEKLSFKQAKFNSFVKAAKKYRSSGKRI